MKPRERSGLLDRRTQQRDARLFVIAVEGEQTGSEYAYFTALEARGLLDLRRVRLVLLPADAVAHDSAPRQVLERLQTHATTFPLRAIDERWLVLDRDRWTDRMLSEVCQDARQADYDVALSNPCFELWILLHETADLAFLADIDPPRRSKACKTRLGELRSAGVCVDPTRSGVWRARDAAASHDVDPGARWPHEPGSRMYRLIDALADANALAR
jgi:hypothetical protein